MADQPFFITGLPRSRTAWMAVAATGRDSVCHHEPGAGDYASAAALWSKPSVQRVGISDSRLGMVLPRILAEVGPRTLIIERDPDDVITSYAAYAKADAESVRRLAGASLAQLQAALSIDHPLIRRVRFEALTDIGTVQECMAWLGVKPRALQQLMRMNIQSDFDFNLAKAQALVAA